MTRLHRFLVTALVKKLLLAALASIGAAARADPTPPAQVETAAAAPEPDTLLKGEVDHGGYGGPRISFGRVAGHDAVVVGGEGGWIVDHKYILGCAAYGLASNQPVHRDHAASGDLAMGYGGALLGFTLLPGNLVHATITTLIGAGGLGARAHDGGGTRDLGDSFFVVEPAATVELNVAQHFRTGVAVSYRWVRGVDTPGFSNGDFSGVFGSMIFKFGKF